MAEELQIDSEQSTTAPYISSELAEGLERTQIAKYHTRGGYGFAAEDANALADRLRLRGVEVTGTNNSANGPDRVVNGVPVQTKYCQTPAQTISAAFHAETGAYRYTGQVFEVPRDQYEECIRLMQDKIVQGKVPGVTDPQEAEYLVKRGSVTYKQARNIARAGNIDSLMFDTKTQAVTTSYVFAVSFAVQFAKRIWGGENTEDALAGAIEGAVAAGGTTLVTGIIAAQVLRTRAAAVGAIATRKGVRAVASTSTGKKAIERLAQASLGKAVYGAAAINHVAKLLRSNVITSTIVTAVTSTPDVYRALFAQSISWPQLAKNVTVNAGGVAAGAGGWMGGAALGAAIGSAVPLVGTAIGGAIGGIIGSLAGGFVGTAATKSVVDSLVQDDSKRMLRLLQDALEELADEYLLSEDEISELGSKVQETVDAKWLRRMYQAGSSANSDADRRAFAYNAFDEVCLHIVQKRPPVLLPPPEVVEEEIDHLARAIICSSDDPGAALVSVT